ncbi:DNA-binding protein [Providencia vermicola]|uniref:MerR family regulatory protein n=1 Tax=Providencia rettgeri TaxID=587 RepID=A0A0U3UHH6_PRORE|nr:MULTISPECIES: DNA-binding protein [Morganellaceae]ELN4025499.1 DNA-binding protein [Proteus mirabilis]ALV81859.1 MerR family regulatory protein [Providencia rettgeri]MBN4867694.1 DNA-binding protein [Providencia stuartii]MBN4877192.1 DNA-binding protein [Providencia stuartii]MBN4881708.1 DNA-binding protein [Providencia stuartii]
MALVSISEAARLTGKARSTLHKYIKQGRLSTTTDQNTGKKTIETSELIRVFGKISNLPTTISDSITSVSKLQPETQNDTQSLQAKLQLLEQENTHLKAEKELLSKNLDDIRQAMLLIESKLPTTPEPVAPVPTKKPWQFWKK